MITLDQQAKEELSWWITNMQIYNGKSLLIVSPDLTIFSDSSKKGWGVTCQGSTTGGRWSSVEKAWHINVLELEAVRLAILSFTKFKKLNSIHLRIDNMQLSYSINMGGTPNKYLIEISREIWGYLTERKIHLTAEYIPNLSNQTADWASRNFQDSSEWKLCPTVFKKMPTATIHSLANRPSKCSNRCISTRLEISISVCFSTILNDRKSMIIEHDHCYTCLAKPVMVFNSVKNDYQKSNSFTKSSKSFTHSRRENSSSNSKLITDTGAMASIRQSLSSKGILERSITFFSGVQRKGSQSNYESTWRKWVSWFHRKQTDPFSKHLREVLDFLAEIFELGFEYSTINTHRSAISAFHEPTEGFSVGKHPKICNLMADVYNNRPSKPRYCLV